MTTPRNFQRLSSEVYKLWKIRIKLFEVQDTHDMTGANKLDKSLLILYVKNS